MRKDLFKVKRGSTTSPYEEERFNAQSKSRAHTAPPYHLLKNPSLSYAFCVRTDSASVSSFGVDSF
jgi:hypothetical protein